VQAQCLHTGAGHLTPSDHTNWPTSSAGRPAAIVAIKVSSASPTAMAPDCDLVGLHGIGAAGQPNQAITD